MPTIHVTDGLRAILAPNPGPFTLSGTHTYLLGTDRVAVVDPGPATGSHVEAVAGATASARHVTLLPTHGHDDHAGAVEALAEALEGGPTVEVARTLGDGDAISTDAGDLIALHTPGHTRDHHVFHWREREALFAGDLVLGEGDTTWVAEYPGCVADYLASLEVVRSVPLSIVYPAHGPPLEDPAGAWDRYEAHRRARIARAREARARKPGGSAEELMELVYGDVPQRLEKAALQSLRAILEYVDAHPDP